MAQGFGKDQIQEQWKQCRYYSSSTEISTFACKDFSAIDIDGFWSRERDLLAARTEAQKFGRAPLPTEVYFPGQERPGDSESRAQFYFRRSLFRRTSSKFGSLIKLDEAFSNLVHARFKAPPSKITEEVVVDRAFDLLSRLPATPLPLPNPPRPPEFVEGDETYGWLRVDPDRAGCSWESLDVVRTFAKPVIWMALAIAVTWDRDRRQDGNEFSKESHAFRKFINSVSDLIESISYERKPNEEVGGGPSWRWFVLKAYLWSTWQRCISLHYWRILQDHLILGFDYTDLSEMELRPNEDSVIASEQQIVLKSEYMCNLAYQILHKSRSASLLDLRLFHMRFNDLFGGRPGRCYNSKACDGTSPAKCQRIQGAVVLDQSQHDVSCGNHADCHLISWDDTSYTDLQGARAVSISLSNDSVQNGIRYEEASTRTLAVSHVWSHGQGSRPEKGLNACLHRRYCKIARDFDCTSYWIDAACIPSEHNLRKEAIMTINQVFQTSPAVLICDKDLMEIDVTLLKDSNSLSRAAVSLRESILATVIVSDWNVRAWTLLEALRGRKNIQLLCKAGEDKVVLSLQNILEIVTFNGGINISIVLLMSYHLFPPPDEWSWLIRHTSGAALKASGRRKVFDSSYDACNLAKRLEAGYLNASEAATALSQRFASRPGDDVIIWSLLVGDKPFKQAVDLWTPRGGNPPVHYDQIIYTGFLISSVPRLSTPGLHWAPAQPGPQTTRDDQQTFRFPPYDGNMTEVGVIEQVGQECVLRAKWGVSRIEYVEGHPWSYEFSSYGPNPENRELHPFVVDRLPLGGYGILLQALQEAESEAIEDSLKLGVTRPIALASVYKGPSRGPVFALCGSYNGVNWPWTWLGVFDWGDRKPLPYFRVEEILLQ